jgi:LacI family transcriptional regulator
MVKEKTIPTLHDVARQAGVSTATVSRCLNTPDRVIEPTRKKVLEAIKALGYSPHFGARVMAAKRTNIIGAIIPTMDNAVFARGLQAFQEELRQLGYTVLVASSSYRAEVEHEQIHSLVAHGAEGLLLIGHDRDPGVYEFLDKQGIAALVTWAVDPDRSHVSIGFDNAAAMQTLGREVLRLGHRRLAMISAETADNDRARERVRGLRAALAEAGLPETALHIVETVYGIDEGAQAFAEIFDRPAPHPTAVICGNDVLATGALYQARCMGLDVPRDVSITGFDDIDLAHITAPALTTVHVPHREMGRRAARALVGMVRKEGAPKGAVLDTHLVVRESLGPPHKN